MGGGDEPCDGVCGPAVTRGAGGPRAVRGDVCRHPGDGSLQCVQLVPGAVAAALLGALTERFRRDARPWWVLRGAWRRLADAGAPDVYLVASGARGHLKTLDISLLHDPTAPRGRAVIGSREALWYAQDRGDVPRHPAAARGAVDVCAGGRGGADE